MNSPPPEKVKMKAASTAAVCITAFFYLCCGGFGYGAFGNSTPGNLLTGFGFYEPYWLVNFANACVVLHLVGGYQVFSQPLFAIVERWITIQFPDSIVVKDIYSLKLPLLPRIRMNLLRVFFRTAYVASITGVGIAFPYFNQVIGVAGAINFWPVVIYFPIEMYLVQKNIGSRTTAWVILRLYSLISLIVILFAFIGSVKGLINARFG